VSELKVETEGGRLDYRPGEEVRGTASWSLEEPPRAVELRLFWRTEGKGTQDIGLAETVPFEGAGQQDHRDFRLRLPEAPYSFSGKLVSLVWALELVAKPGALAGRTDVVITPTGREILLTPKEG
jgi:hypothetical protein